MAKVHLSSSVKQYLWDVNYDLVITLQNTGVFEKIYYCPYLETMRACRGLMNEHLKRPKKCMHDYTSTGSKNNIHHFHLNYNITFYYYT